MIAPALKCLPAAERSRQAKDLYIPQAHLCIGHIFDDPVLIATGQLAAARIEMDRRRLDLDAITDVFLELTKVHFSILYRTPAFCELDGRHAVPVTKIA